MTEKTTSKKSYLGFTNLYLKVGATIFLLAALVALSALVFNLGEGSFRAVVFLLAAAIVFYVIGRVVKATGK